MSGSAAATNERSGLLLALAGFALLSVGDAVVKTMAGEWSPIAVAALRFAIGAVALSAFLGLKEGGAAFRPTNFWLQLARGGSLAFATLFFFTSIFLMPLAETMALTFVSPIFVALLSGPLLGEKVRRMVWVGCLLALVGVSLILRPNFAELGWVVVLPLVTALFFALMVIANRASAGQGSALAMQAYIAVVAAPILLAAAWVGTTTGIETLQFGWPAGSVIARCAVVAMIASTAHWLVYLGTMRAGAASIAPMTYVQMLVATLLGWWLFGDVPDMLTVLGAAIIIGVGLILWRDSTKSSSTT